MANFVINATASGDTELVAAPSTPGSFIRLIGYHITTDAVVVATLKGGATTKDVCYATKVVGGGIVVPDSPDVGVFDCPANTALVINLSGTANVGGAGNYIIIP